MQDQLANLNIWKNCIKIIFAQWENSLADWAFKWPRKNADSNEAILDCLAAGPTNSLWIRVARLV